MSTVPERLVEIRKLHAAYVRLTGLAIPLDLQGYREMLWSAWLREGFTEADLVSVVRYVKSCIRNNDRGFNLGSLRFNSLIGQVDRFGELLAEAGAIARGPRPDRDRDAVLRASGRPGTQSPAANTQSLGHLAAQVTSDPVKAAAAIEELRKLKTSL